MNIAFGALCDPIGQQLYNHGWELSGEDSIVLQNDADAITRLAVRGLLSEREVHRSRRRLLKEIRRKVVPVPTGGEP